MAENLGKLFKKSRNYGESAADLQNRLDLVAALLALADEKIEISSENLEVKFKLEWVTASRLRVSGIVEEKQRNGRITQEEKGITQDALGALLEIYCQEKILPSARKQIIHNTICCLKDLEILKEDEKEQKHKNRGFWKFFLDLKHHTAERSENLQVIKDRWKTAFGDLPKLESKKLEDEGLDWERICRENLPLRRDLTSNELASGVESKRNIDQVYVPLALVERRVRQERQGDGLQGQMEGKEEEKLVSISEDSFFEEVLRQGRGESKGRRIALIGEPGAGKTTRLQKIADWILEEKLGLPI